LVKRSLKFIQYFKATDWIVPKFANEVRTGKAVLKIERIVVDANMAICFGKMVNRAVNKTKIMMRTKFVVKDL